MTVAGIDFETRSTVDLRKTGPDPYAQHPETGVWCVAWALDDAEPEVWCPGDPDPTPLLEHIARGGAVRAWNVAFEDSIWRHVIARICPHWPALPVEQQIDTMAQAYALSLPGGLDSCAKALGLEIGKDMSGYRLMMTMARPRRIKAVDGRPVWWDVPERLAALKAYCAQDVRVERLIATKLAPLPERERRVWQLDHVINRRGVLLDLPTIDLARLVVEDETRDLNAEIAQITDGVVSRASNPGAITAWLNDRGVPVANLRKDTVATMLGANLPDAEAERVLQIRAEVGKASTAKLTAMKAATSTDGRARWLLGYHVASTGRWAGRRVQPQNLPRPSISAEEIEEVIDLLGAPAGRDIIRASYGAPMECIASCLRSMIIPARGHRFVGGDLSNIEGRVLAWLAGENWKLKAFREFDEGRGDDLYVLAYARSFGLSPKDVGKGERQIGKVQELALGYSGGPAAFLSMAANYGTDIEAISKATIAAAGDDWNEHVDWLARWKYTPQHYGMLKDRLTYEEWCALKFIVARWRAAHPAIKLLWQDLSDCAMSAVQRRGAVTETDSGLLRFVFKGAFLWFRLPSGRCLAYPHPYIKDEPDEITGEMRPGLRFWGWDGITKRWAPQRLYGGLLAENASQAVSRDILVDAMFRIEKAGAPIVLHVHDELLSEVANSHPITAEDYRRLMSVTERWADGLPVAAKAWTGARYGKE